MEQYDNYKDSDIAWLENVPNHWDIAPYKRAVIIKNGKDYKDVQVNEGGFPVIGSGGEFAKASNYLYDGEVILMGRKGTINKPLYFKGKFWSVDTMFYCIPRKAVCGKYIYYQATIFPFNLYSTSTALPSMTQSDLCNNPIVLPPLAEQQQIASYLDTKTEKIDKMIAKAKKKIEYLGKLKQSVITRAVTRGLNPNAPLKNSEVKWIGDIPIHWDIACLRFFLKLINGRAYSQNELLPSGKYKVLRVGNFFTNDSWYYSNMELGPDKYCDKDDLLYAWSASVGPYIWNEAKTIYHYHIWKVQLATSMDKMYSYYLLRAVTNQKMGDMHGSTMMHITMSDMNKTKIPIPPISEQQQIATYLDIKCSKIDHIIATQKKKIAYLQELKQSLITNVVTGKIKVS
ncbi:restriction endonuclease subunit S [Phocaeicola sartorii]|uniref:Type I restriction modification DNA specificity domain-containing protein n=1 Tax=Phocaeicola sartorii TaxID=671267 RepID=R9HYS1_9BACT|nr:restriction endonuclease subunit S [Phocaeicola sartorii]EOS09104.1 hypothetical protein C802_04097 [Phocaeicola sartorii]MCR1846155.1 restriction endonuclease subunit S [Phocaeicola sartorii]NUL01043.1 restriction endonuclease subunit S [Phocaeicola sartorii]